MAITRGATTTPYSTSDTVSNVSFTHTVDANTTLLLVVCGTEANYPVTDAPVWDAAGVNETLTLIHQTTSSAASGDVTVYIYGKVNPTANNSKLITYTVTSNDNHWAYALNYLGTATASLAAAAKYLNETVNNTGTETTVLASGGITGNTLLAGGMCWGGDMDPASNATGFTEIGDAATGTNTTADHAFYVAELIGGAPEAITITWAGTDENAGQLIELCLPFNARRQSIIDGLDSAQSETYGWDAEVKAKIPVTDVVRTSDTVVTITLSAEAAYDITAQETITVTVPAVALAGNTQIVATPTFTVDTAAAGVEVGATCDALAITEYAANINEEISFTATCDALTVITYDATVKAEVNIQTSTDSLACISYATVVKTDISISTAVDSLTITPNAATINAKTELSASYDELTITTYGATVHPKVNILASYDSLALTEQSAYVNAETSIAASYDSLALTEYGTGVNAEVKVSASYDAISVTGHASGVNAETSIASSYDALTLTAYASDVDITSAGVDVDATADNLALTGYVADITVDVSVQATTSDLTLTEYLSTVNAETNIAAGVSNLLLAESAAMVKTDHNVQATADALTITAYQATVSISCEILVSIDILNLTEHQVTVSLHVDVLASVDNLSMTENIATINAETNVLAVYDALILNEYKSIICYSGITYPSVIFVDGNLAIRMSGALYTKV